MAVVMALIKVADYNCYNCNYWQDGYCTLFKQKLEGKYTYQRCEQCKKAEVSVID